MIDATKINAILAKNAPLAFKMQVPQITTLYDLITRQPNGLRTPSSAQGPTFEVEVSGHTGAVTFAESDPAPAESQTEIVNAEADGWGRYAATIKLSGETQRKLDLGGPSYVEDYFVKQVRGATKAILTTLEGHIKGAFVPNGIAPLCQNISDTGIYYNIDRAVYPNWQSYVNANGGVPRAVSAALLGDVHKNLVDVNDGNYSVIFGDRTQCEAVAAITHPTIQKIVLVQDPSNSFTPIVGVGGIDKLKPACFYNERPVIPIAGYPSGRLDFIDLSAVFFEELSGPPQVEMLANTDTAKRWIISYYVQLAIDSCHKGAASLQDLS